MSERTRADVEAELAAARKKLADAIAARDHEMVESKKPFASERDPTGWDGFAADVYEKFFQGYPLIDELIDRLKAQVERRFWVISPTGRRRTLYRVLTGNPKFLADAQRRGVNSPIQGISSEGGITAGYLILLETEKFLRHWELPLDLMTCYSRAVHDANYFEEKYAMLIPSIHIQQHVATVGLHKHFLDVYGEDFILDMEIDIEVGPSDARGKSWNWELVNLPAILIEAIDGRIADGAVKASNRQKLIDTVMSPWVRKDMRQYLQENYPLMGVTDLDAEICLALEENGFTPER